MTAFKETNTKFLYFPQRSRNLKHASGTTQMTASLSLVITPNHGKLPAHAKATYAIRWMFHKKWK